MIERQQSNPHIKNTPDGRLLICSNGHPHWLTLWERILLSTGWLTIEQLDKKIRLF